MDKELFMLAHAVSTAHLYQDGEATYALYEAMERAYALGVKDHTDDARRTAYAEGYREGIEEGAFHAYLDCATQERNGPDRAPAINAQVEGFDYPAPRWLVDAKGVITPFETPFSRDIELHTAVANLG